MKCHELCILCQWLACPLMCSFVAAWEAVNKTWFPDGKNAGSCVVFDIMKMPVVFLVVFSFCLFSLFLFRAFHSMHVCCTWMFRVYLRSFFIFKFHNCLHKPIYHLPIMLHSLNQTVICVNKSKLILTLFLTLCFHWQLFISVCIKSYIKTTILHCNIVWKLVYWHWSSLL